MDAPTSQPELGKYRLLEEVGRGGFAVVYRALDTTLKREVAIKILFPVLIQDNIFVARFYQEAATVAGLDHPHIVPVYDVAQQDTRLFIAMKLVRGSSLNKLLEQRKALPWDEAMALMRPICAALDYAHGKGVIHRDFKPANVLIDEHGSPFISDFGFARAIGTNSVSSSLSTGIVGTPAYIAPEVWDKNAATPAVDIYALGCTLYEMLTGTLLFSGETPIQALRAHDRGPVYPDQWPQGVPPGLPTVLDCALAKDPAARYPSAGALLRDLEALGRGEAIAPVMPPMPAQDTVAGPRRGPSLPLLIGGGLTAVLLIAALLFTVLGPGAGLQATATAPAALATTETSTAAAIGETTAATNETPIGGTPTMETPSGATPTLGTPVAVSTSGFNVRAGPATTYPPLAQYGTGTRLELLGREPTSRWVQVRMPDNRVGWVAVSVLEPNPAITGLPIVPTPTRPPATPTRPSATPTRRPTTAVPTIFVPTTAVPTIFVPTTAVPTIFVPTTAVPTIFVPTTAVPTLTLPPPDPGPYGSTIDNPPVLGDERPLPISNPALTVLAVLGASTLLGLRPRRGRRRDGDER